ncbi:MAG: ATP-binding protein [Clostridiaceae bacterium]
MIKEYLEKINSVYSDIRSKNKSQLRERREEIDSKLPKVSEIERKIGRLSVELSISAIRGNTVTDKDFSELKEKITSLRAEKYELLVSNGYSMDYLELKYDCHLCKDTGYVGNKRCPCYKEKISKLYLKDSNLNKILDKNSFKNFSLSFYGSENSGYEKDSPRKNMEKVLSSCYKFIEEFPDSNENLLFYGTPGTGKTHLSHAIAAELLKAGYFILYKTSEDLIQDLRDIRFNKDKYREEVLEYSDLLIIDDFGTEENNDFSRAEFFNLLNKRLLNEKKLIISTNLELENILKNYNDRITSRLLGNFTICKFYGDDIRVKKNIHKIKK